MRIELDDIVIRDFKRTDAESLWKIVRERDIVRFMKDWSENGPSPKDYFGYLDWLQAQKNSVDVYENKRYAIVLHQTDKLIGMVVWDLKIP
ncbi:GNAT family N-acetyltransferase [Caproicibacter sp.]|uniref:GNAT family N-acetyltransferase n=1 Tax=Caproicibacter sp. TaxID=2814884 RepID=UPI0039899B5A